MAVTTYAPSIYNKTLNMKQVEPQEQKGGLLVRTNMMQKKDEETPFDFVMGQVMKIRSLRNKVKEGKA